MMSADEAFAVDPGWVKSEVIRAVNEGPFRLLTYADGTVRFEHRCDRGERGVIICAPALSPGHVVTESVRLDGTPGTTVTPSNLCPDCGTHGFVTDGRWIG